MSNILSATVEIEGTRPLLFNPCPRGIRISGVSRRSSPISVGRRQTCPRTLEGAPGILSPPGMLEIGTDPDDQIPVCQRPAHQPISLQTCAIPCPLRESVTEFGYWSTRATAHRSFFR